MPKPESPCDVLFVDLEPELATTRRVLERVPQGKEDWRPHTKSRTLGELATHLAQLPGFGILMLTQDEFNGNPAELAGPKFASNADRLRAFDQVSSELRRIAREMTWDHARSPWALRVGDRTVLNAPRVNVLRTAFITHSAHHRAQLGVYLRLLEESVPATYGPSADEQFNP
jgi:uncharacterized damage-inducible protein DinB